MVSGQLIYTCKRIELDPYLTPCTKINSKCIIDLNIRVKTMKLSEENTGGNIHDLGFLDIKSMKKIEKLDFIKTENYFASKDINKKVKRQPE